MSLSRFASRMRQLGRNVETGTNKVKRKVALIVDREVVLATPVDTGRARSNWIASLGIPSTGEREPYSPGEKLGLGERANAQAAIDQASARIAVAQPGQDIYISNNVSYIETLNSGSSAQAASGYVQTAVLVAAGAVRGARVLDG